MSWKCLIIFYISSSTEWVEYLHTDLAQYEGSGFLCSLCKWGNSEESDDLYSMKISSKME